MLGGQLIERRLPFGQAIFNGAVLGRQLFETGVEIVGARFQGDVLLVLRRQIGHRNIAILCGLRMRGFQTGVGCAQLAVFGLKLCQFVTILAAPEPQPQYQHGEDDKNYPDKRLIHRWPPGSGMDDRFVLYRDERRTSLKLCHVEGSHIKLSHIVQLRLDKLSRLRII